MLNGNAVKGDVLGAARIAGIMAAKRTHQLIPLCHPLPITKVAIDIEPDHSLPGFVLQATVKVTGQTGVEMEALTAVSVACLTLYDMVKAVERACGSKASGCSKSRAASPATTAPKDVSRVAWRCCRWPTRSPACSMASSRCRAKTLPLDEADGRVLAGDVAALRTQPPADLSAMDGYAVRAADVAERAGRR